MAEAVERADGLGHVGVQREHEHRTSQPPVARCTPRLRPASEAARGCRPRRSPAPAPAPWRSRPTRARRGRNAYEERHRRSSRREVLPDGDRESNGCVTDCRCSRMWRRSCGAIRPRNYGFGILPLNPQLTLDGRPDPRRRPGRLAPPEATRGRRRRSWTTLAGRLARQSVSACDHLSSSCPHISAVAATSTGNLRI
jgi:hypothetical protein